MPVYAVSGWSGLSGSLFLIVAIVCIVTIGRQISSELRAIYEQITSESVIHGKDEGV